MVPQFFLPVSTPDNRILAALAISLTTFTGNEQSINIAPWGNLKLKHVSIIRPVSLQAVDYMAIDCSLSDERNMWKAASNRLLPPIDNFTFWQGSGNFQQMQFRQGDLETLLMGQSNSAGYVAVIPTVPTGSNVSKTWYANSP